MTLVYTTKKIRKHAKDLRSSKDLKTCLVDNVEGSLDFAMREAKMVLQSQNSQTMGIKFYFKIKFFN